jgi:hypothetical protein
MEIDCVACICVAMAMLAPFATAQNSRLKEQWPTVTPRSRSEIDYRKPQEATLRDEVAQEPNLGKLISDRVLGSSKDLISAGDVNFSVDSRGKLRKIEA